MNHDNLKQSFFKKIFSNSATPYKFIIPAFMVITFIYFYPIIYNFYLSFFQMYLVEPGVHYVGLKNYFTILSDSAFWRSLRLLFVWIVGTVPFVFILGLSSAILLNQNVPGIIFFRSLFFLPWILPDYIVSNLFRWLYNPTFGVVNYLLTIIGINAQNWVWFSDPHRAMFSVITVCIWKAPPFIMLMCLAGLQSVPPELDEAATIDGANSWQRFWYITIPHLKPVIITSNLIMTLWVARTIDLIYVATKGGPLDATTTLPILTYRTAFVNFRFGLSATLAIIFIVLIFGAIMIVGNRLIKGED